MSAAEGSDCSTASCSEPDHLAVGRDPIADAGRVTAFDGGETAVDGIGVIRVRDDIVKSRVRCKRNDDNGDAQRNDPYANGGEHVGVISNEAVSRGPLGGRLIHGIRRATTTT